MDLPTAHSPLLIVPIGTLVRAYGSRGKSVTSSVLGGLTWTGTRGRGTGGRARGVRGGYGGAWGASWGVGFGGASQNGAGAGVAEMDEWLCLWMIEADRSDSGGLHGSARRAREARGTMPFGWASGLGQPSCDGDHVSLAWMGRRPGLGSNQARLSRSWPSVVGVGKYGFGGLWSASSPGSGAAARVRRSKWPKVSG